MHAFSNEATKWGCEHEMEALQSYKAKNAQAHHGLIASQCGFYVNVEHLFWVLLLMRLLIANAVGKDL